MQPNGQPPDGSGVVKWYKTSAGLLRCILSKEGVSGLPRVALPGAAGRAEQLAHIGGDGSLLALDWPGSGESTDTTPRCSTFGLARLVIEILEQLEWPRIVVLGHSLGAMVAMHLAEHPRVAGVVLLAPSPGLLHCIHAGIWPHPLSTILLLIVCALTLCNPFAINETSKSDLNEAWILHGFERRTLHGKYHETAAQCFATKGSAGASGWAVWLRRRIGDISALLAVISHRMPRQLSGLSCALIWGDCDALINADASRLTETLLKTSGQAPRLVKILPGSGHFMHWDSPHAVAQACNEACESWATQSNADSRLAGLRCRSDRIASEGCTS